MFLFCLTCFRDKVREEKRRQKSWEEQSLLSLGQAHGGPYIQGEAWGGGHGWQGCQGHGKRLTVTSFQTSFPHLPVGEESALENSKFTSHHSFCNIRPSPHSRDKATIFEDHTPTLPPPQDCLLEQRGPSLPAQKNLGLYLIQGSNKWPFCSML